MRVTQGSDRDAAAQIEITLAVHLVEVTARAAAEHDIKAAIARNDVLEQSPNARMDALINGWIEDTGERDAWQLGRQGRRVLERTIERYKSGELIVRKCYLWRPKFKKLIDPAYEPSPDDSVRAEECFAVLLE